MNKATLPNPFAPVSLEPITSTGVTLNKVSVMLKEEGQEPFSAGIVGKDYGLFSNRQAVNIAEEIIHRSNMDFTTVNQIWNGKQFWQTYKTEKAVIELPSINDVIQFGIGLTNSYDGTCKLRLSLMAYVVSCTNGMTNNQEWGHFSIRHQGVDQVNWQDAEEQIAHGFDRIATSKDVFVELTKRQFKINHLLNVAGTSISPTFMGKFVKEIAVDKPKSCWDAMQCATSMLRDPKTIAGINQIDLVTSAFMGLVNQGRN